MYLEYLGFRISPSLFFGYLSSHQDSHLRNGTVEGVESCLLCFHQKGELVWQNPEYNTCTYPYDAVEENKDSEISIYPNPGNNTLNICTTLQNACVEVYDMNGRIVHSQEITENVTAINTKNWSDGIYLWKVISDGKEVESGKWIKE